MKLMILYRDNSEHARPVIDFVEMMSRRYPDKQPEILDLDTKDGASKATLYGIDRYPAIILVSHDGLVIQQWEGLPLPLIDEVAGQMVVTAPVSV